MPGPRNKEVIHLWDFICRSSVDRTCGLRLWGPSDITRCQEVRDTGSEFCVSCTNTPAAPNHRRGGCDSGSSELCELPGIWGAVDDAGTGNYTSDGASVTCGLNAPSAILDRMAFRREGWSAGSWYVCRDTFSLIHHA